MVTRRHVAGLAVVALIVTSGCIGFLTGEEPLRYAANDVAVSDDALAATEYELQSVENVTINQSVNDREIIVTNRLARYEKYDAVAEETTGVLAVVSTHRVDVFDRTSNPIAEMTYAQLLTNLTSSYETEFGALEDATFQENRTQTVLGTEARVGVFTTTTQFGGEEVEVKLYVTRVRHGDDFVIAIGGHPTKLPVGEQEILRLMAGIQHDTDGNASAAIVPSAVAGDRQRLAATATTRGDASPIRSASQTAFIVETPVV